MIQDIYENGNFKMSENVVLLIVQHCSDFNNDPTTIQSPSEIFRECTENIGFPERRFEVHKVGSTIR